MPLEDELDRRGFTLGHFPSSILCSTVGGWVAARSAGQASGYYGKIEDMVMALECVTGTGEVVRLHHRTRGPNLIPLVVGSEGTLCIVTSATLRLHPRPTARAFASWSLPSTERGWEAMRAMFQEGLRPAIARLYDPFDAMLARQGAVKRAGAAGAERNSHRTSAGSPAQAALRVACLQRPNALNELIELAGTRASSEGRSSSRSSRGPVKGRRASSTRARAVVGGGGREYEGEGAAQAVASSTVTPASYRQAPVFASGAFFVGGGGRGELPYRRYLFKARCTTAFARRWRVTCS